MNITRTYIFAENCGETIVLDPKSSEDAFTLGDYGLVDEYCFDSDGTVRLKLNTWLDAHAIDELCAFLQAAKTHMLAKKA